MKKYIRKRTLTELKPIFNERQWVLDTTRFDEGDDHVVVKFHIPGDAARKNVHLFTGTLYWNTVSGSFFGDLDGHPRRHFSSDNQHFDGEAWMQYLLDTFFEGDAACSTPANESILKGNHDPYLDVKEVYMRVPGRVNRFEPKPVFLCKTCRKYFNGQFRYPREADKHRELPQS